MTGRRVTDLAGHDAYEVIGVPDTATEAQIRRAYRRAMLRAHPDRGGPEDQAKLISCALELLLQDRAKYDEYRRRQAQRASPHPTGPPGAHPPPATARDTGPEPAPQPGPADEDWPEDDWLDGEADDGDPWDTAQDGVGTPGRGADAPGAADHPPGPPAPESHDGADRLYRPFTPGGVKQADPWLLGPLLNSAFALAAVVVVGVLIGVGVSAGNSGSPSYYTPPLSVPTGTYGYGYTTPFQYPNPVSSFMSSLAANPHYTPFPPPSALNRNYAALALFPTPDHSCYRLARLELRCSGTNDHGQLGVGDRRAHTGARPVVGGHRWLAVALGRQHTCAIRSDRSLWCWGANAAGQLGTGTGTQDRTVPREVRPGYRWRSVAAYDSATCAVRTTGSLWCWGTPQGPGHPPASRVPRQYGTSLTWTRVRTGATGLCARRAGHPDTCWTG
jgi:hypothetical protein